MLIATTNCMTYFVSVIANQGFIYRNCTKDGWSEKYPRPYIACGLNVEEINAPIVAWQRRVSSNNQYSILWALSNGCCFWVEFNTENSGWAIIVDWKVFHNKPASPKHDLL